MEIEKDKIQEKIRELRKEIGKEMQSDFDRFLPLDEMLLRYEKGKEWDKASLLNFGEGSVVHETSYVYGRPKVGKNVWIGPLTLIDGSGGLEIGDNSDISSGVQIYTHSTHMRILSDGKEKNVLKPVKIENNVFVGACAVILSGVTIGHHSLVAAGAVVTKDIPPKTIVAGVPAIKSGEVEINEQGNVKLNYKERE